MMYSKLIVREVLRLADFRVGYWNGAYRSAGLAWLRVAYGIVTGVLQMAVRVNLPSTGITLAKDVYGPFSGQVTSAVRQAMRRAVLEAHARLVEAMFLCEVSSTAEVLSGAQDMHSAIEQHYSRPC